MMKQMRYSLALCAALAASVSALHANGDETTWEPNYLETARSYCAPQVEALLEVEENTAKLLQEAKIEWDPELPEDQHRAFNKSSALVIVMAGQASRSAEYRWAIKGSKPVSEQLIASNKSLLDLSDCLWLSQEDQDLIQELTTSFFVNEAGEDPIDSSTDVLFTTLKQAECFRWNEASRRILKINPESEGAEARMYEVLQDTIGQCEESFELPFERKF